ncbi:hypothetical protein EMMF5_003784 [Cystobasidiomycetes sp. EMM_F5]
MVSFTFIATLGFAAAASVSAGRGDRAHRRAEIEICPTACPPMANNDWRRSTVSYSGSDLFNYEHDGKIGWWPFGFCQRKRHLPTSLCLQDVYDFYLYLSPQAVP